MKPMSLASRSGYLVCPLCEVGRLRHPTNDSTRCESCGGSLSRATLETLRSIAALFDALGSHACEECHHPEMRRLPDGTYHCPACRSEVGPVVDWDPDVHRESYWDGWVDGRYAAIGSFVDNSNVARWKATVDRLAYYKGHRAGREVRARRQSEREEVTMPGNG